MLGSGQVHRLTEQYRMHPHICQAISRCFYQGRVITATQTAEERFAFAEADDDPNAMVWAQVNGREETPEDGKSYVNRLEIEAIVAAAHRLRERHGPDCTIAALTFYKVGRRATGPRAHIATWHNTGTRDEASLLCLTPWCCHLTTCGY